MIIVMNKFTSIKLPKAKNAKAKSPASIGFAFSRSHIGIGFPISMRNWLISALETDEKFHESLPNEIYPEWPNAIINMEKKN